MLQQANKFVRGLFILDIRLTILMTAVVGTLIVLKEAGIVQL